MTTPSANPVSTISPAEIQILVARTGLVLNPGQLADLVLAWRQVAGLIADMKRDPGLVDDMALAFRLPPPAPEAPVAAVASRKGGRSAAAKPKTAVRPETAKRARGSR